MAFSKRLLIWDSFCSHITEEAKEHIKQTNTIMGVIPGGCTKLLQLADVSWNTLFKAVYRELYEKWLQEPACATDLTPAGNPRAPSRLAMVNWVKEAWQLFSTDIIVHSCEACGITSDDPDCIHCMKESVIAEVRKKPSRTWMRACSMWIPTAMTATRMPTRTPTRMPTRTVIVMTMRKLTFCGILIPFCIAHKTLYHTYLL